MEKNLSLNRLELSSLISSYPPLADAVAAVAGRTDLGPIDIKGLKGSLPSFFISLYMERIGSVAGESPSRDCIIVTPGQKEGDECESDLETILGQNVSIYKLPWWGTMPYRSAAPSSSVFGERAAFLAHLSVRSPAGGKRRMFIVPQRALLTPLPPPEYERKLLRKISKGQTVDTQILAKDLISLGYVRVPRVTVRGEFALHGEVLDIFMPGDRNAYRILFDFDTIEHIKAFDPETQGTSSKNEEQESLVLYPMKEVVWDDDLCTRLEKVLEKEDREGISSEDIGRVDSGDIHLGLTDEGRKEKERLLTELSVNGCSEGEELFYGSLWDKKYGLADYIMEETPVFFMEWERQVNAVKMLYNEYTAAYRIARQKMPVLRPKEMVLDFETSIRCIANSIFFRTVGTDVLQEEFSFASRKELLVPSQDSQSFFGNINYFKETLTSLRQAGYRIFVFADNPNQSLRIGELLKDFMTEEGGFPVKVEPLSLTAGFSIEGEKILVVQENEIFGRRKAAPASIRRAKSRVIDNFVELNPGDYVVHANYGIGLFKGIERVKSQGTERDYIKLEYADKDFIFVPIEQVNMVQRYIGNEGSHPQLDHIGSKSWKNRKDKVQKKVEEMAEKLIDLYSKRQASRGFPFPRDGEWQTAFEAAFPYEDTPDQVEAAKEIKDDMERPIPMDRLLCGDVGYGKTEVAMRAAFKAVMGGKQVAFLAPTTILADQHYESCVERFKNFPVHIAMLSRFVAPAEQKKIIAALAQGEVDILVGTHRIIQKDIVYKDLGLMIIDEEQRFGVKDKEKLKTLKTNIDCLAMSATPIPRTLHMSLLKIRDMSLLTTPPQNRQPIETSIESFSGDKIARAIRREVERGGQVFYLHNRVENLLETRIELEKLVPEMLIEVAHGQMSSEELDDIFHRFKMGGFHVLVATTIIENGIDIPNVNTIIIDRADMYGVSQLYQLRGRVGRSDRKAYAYLFYPENRALSEVAMRRLQVISDFTELGSGFKIAMKDMEIRGAGNLLGRDQSGEVYAVGFEMYLSLLNDAIKRLSGSGWKAPDETLLELEYTGFIPDSYISDAQIKMELYKKIAAIGTQGELDAVEGELQDRFGPVPDEVNSLLCLAKIRILCHRLSIISLREKLGDVRVEFGNEAKVNVDKVLSLIKRNPGSVRLDSQHPNQLLLRTNSIELNTKSEFIRDKLEQLVG
ncbi:MAG: transcription-repair coupling factor [Treponema sp.]|nr:transcription-repair coupling factor [Treponema sp.]